MGDFSQDTEIMPGKGTSPALSRSSVSRFSGLNADLVPLMGVSPALAQQFHSFWARMLI